MIRGSSRSKNFFRKLVVNGVNNSKVAIQNDCLMRLYDADAELKAISTELDSFDGKKDPIRCNLLVNQLRTAQDKVISLLFQLMDDCNCERTSRDYRMKFPDEILLSEGSESLNGQIWFGAECLSAGSNILNHTKESTMLRPMAKTLTTSLDSLRNDLRELVIDGGGASRINQVLIEKMVIFDHIFARFEYEYVRTMLPIRTVAEIEKLQEVAVLFSETLIDCVKRGLIKQEDIDEFQPIVMIAIPRLAIVRGLLYKNENPIYTRHKSQMCSLFQPFHGPLHSIRKLLRGLSKRELFSLEKMLANDQTAIESPLVGARTPLVEQEQNDQKPPQQVNQKNESNDSFDEQQTKKDLSQGSDEQNIFPSPGVCNDNNDDDDGDDDENEASTSNNYSNVLMDGLQYPVGQKRSVKDTQDKNYSNEQNIEQTNYEQCCFDGPASSSKLIVSTSDGNSSPKNVTSSPTAACSSPSTTSSVSSNSLDCKRCITGDGKIIADGVVVESQDICDKNCLSPPESDAQLEKLIAEFSPSMNNQDSLPPSPAIETNTTSSSSCIMTDETPATVIQNNSSQSNIGSTINQSSTKIETKNEDEVMEEFFLKQSQQLLHRLFVAISGVADQLQSNFASDLRFILKHIFSTDEDQNDDRDEIIDEENEDGDDSYNREQSDSSLPIEQGIEAREVANLIDLSSGYSLENNYNFDNDMRYLSPAPPPPTMNYSYMNNNDVSDGEGNRYSPSSSLYITSSQQQQQQINANDNNRHHRSGTSNTYQMQQHDINEDVLANFMRPVGNQSELNHESSISPNEASIMDDSRHHRHLIQQHIQANITANRPTTTRSSSSRSHRIGSNGDNTANGQHERRSSRYHRSRRQRGPPVWVPDQLVVACSCCNQPFTLFRRRHHCRACGHIFCADCSKFTKNLNCWGYNGPVRVCESCFNQP